MYRIVGFLLALTIMSSYVTVFAEDVSGDGTGVNIIYVDTNGDDKNSGTIENPLKTLDGARNMVRRIKDENPELPVMVMFREGTYYFTDTVIFDQEDGGTEDAPIIYKAYNDENVEFKGSVPVKVSQFSRIKDNAILKRLPEDVRKKVGVLDLKTQGIDKIEKYCPIGSAPVGSVMGDYSSWSCFR